MHYNKPKDHVPGGNLMSASANARFDDSLWKNLLTEFFVPMLHAVLPEMVPFLDSSRPVRFLDKELRRMAKYALHYEKALAESPNPFDLAHLAALKAWKSRKSDRLKLGYMKEILDLLDERGWTHHQKAQLLTFMEGVMHLNEEDAVQEYEEWEEALERKKEAGRMYISLMERKGMEMGREETKITAAHRMLSRGMAVSLIAELLDLSEDRVRELANRNDMPGCSTSKEHPD